MIVLLSPAVMNHDAVGNDIEAMYKLISQKFECRVFSENQANKRVKYINQNDLQEYFKDAGSIWIYHHSIHWELGEEILHKVNGHIVIKYHNITPPEFFVPYFKQYADLCRDGRNQTERLKEDFPNAIWLSDSIFNSLDIKPIDNIKSFICPPFHKIEDNIGKSGDLATSTLIKNMNGVKLLFVGRIAPNKGHLFLLEVVKNYKINISKDVTLIIVGKFDKNINDYNKKILEKIEEYGLKRNIKFIGEVNDETLRSFYQSCDYFICGSEHEGFCVPIIEAQFFGIPIITISSTAIDETIGTEQIILDRDARQFALSIKLLSEQKNLREKLIEKGKKNFDQRFSNDVITTQLSNILNLSFGINLELSEKKE